MTSTPRTGSSLAQGEEVLWREIVILRRTIERALEHRLQRDAGISVADFEILTTLCRAADGRLRARDLAEVLGWEKSRLSHQVTRMQARGLVAREECPTDLRGTWVVISDAGHDAAGRALDGHAEVLSAHFAALSPDEREALGLGVGRLIRSADPSACQLAGEVLED